MSIYGRIGVVKIAVLEDYQRASPGPACFARLAAHQVEVFSEPMRDEASIAARVKDFEALVLIRERTRITASLLESSRGTS
jgi:D-3-phosphoglycerate dehydrogenase / 2-oxoglutarate reductase